MAELNPYADLEPAELWQHFAELNRIHRPSGGEAAAAGYVRQVAERVGCEVLDTDAGNVVVKKKPTPGREKSPKVAVQAHLDMVCVPESHDFKANPVKPRRVDGRIYASGTSLGADNGIGVAAALALATTQEPHGPLELVFTVHEEDTMDGAKALTSQEVQARLLINLDDETPGCLTVGCAGGEKTLLRLPVSIERADAAWSGWEIAFSGLQGGHSGDEIDQPRANAIKLLTRALRAVRHVGIDFRIASIRGGEEHNAIPKEAVATLAIPAESEERLTRVVASVKHEIDVNPSWKEPDLKLRSVSAGRPDNVLALADGGRLLDLIHVLPHGVRSMMPDGEYAPVPRTSSNLAKVRFENGTVEVLTSSRSSLVSDLQDQQDFIQSVGRLAGAECEVFGSFSGWEPVTGSRLLSVTKAAYAGAFDRQPVVRVIHAGLENASAGVI